MPDAPAQPSPAPSRIVAVILAAGQGRRMGAPRNKVFLPLAGKPLLAHTLAAFARAAEVTDLLLVAHPDELDLARRIAADHGVGKPLVLAAGGATRHQSEHNALDALRPEIEAGHISVVLIHDAARPLVPPADIDALARAARLHGGALLATPLAPDEVAVHLTPDGVVASVPLDPTGLWRAQTPQAFAADALLRAYDLARRDGFEGTDTAASYERLGHPVHVVPGSPVNIKVTTPDDLLRAAAHLSSPAPA
jgi:2-C-methyl-D-erythritol 4-phosphate cytidylyltransferase